MASDVTAIVSGIRGVAIFPRVLFNSSVDINLYFKDAAGNYQSYSGATGYTPLIKVRQPKGFNAMPNTTLYSGTLTLFDGTNSRTLTYNTTDFAAPGGSPNGFLGGYNGIGAGGWIFNGGAGPGVSAAALWPATRCTYRGNLGTTLYNGSIIFEADSVGVQGPLSVTANNIYYPVEAAFSLLRAGTVSVRAMAMFHMTPAANVTVSSFAQITNGWSCTIPFTDPSFIVNSTTANVTVSEYYDYDCEITVTRNADSVVMAVVTARIRVYRKQITLTA